MNDKQFITEHWGEEFVKFADNPKVNFTSESIQVTLKKEVKSLSGEMVKVVEIDEPDVGQLKAIDEAKGEMSKTAKLISTCTDIPGAALNSMKASDFMLLSNIISVFLSDGQETGKT